MKILVIGGNRFFGKALVYKLLDDGHSVTLLNRANLDDGFGDSVQRIICDRSSISNATFGDREFDRVFDQCCYDAKQAKVAIDALRSRTRHYIFTSTQSVYSDGTAIREDQFDPSTYSYKTIADPMTNYGEAKRQAETVFFQEIPEKLTIVRFPFVLGPNDYTRRLEFHTERIQTDRAIFFPNVDAKLSMILEDDAAAFLNRFTSAPVPAGVFNVCAEQPISLAGLMAIIEQKTNKKARISNNPNLGDHSPYGIPSDGYMSPKKAHGLGFRCREILDWLPGLV